MPLAIPRGSKEEIYVQARDHEKNAPAKKKNMSKQQILKKNTPARKKIMSEQQILKKKRPCEEENYVRAVNLEKKHPCEEEKYVRAAHLEKNTSARHKIVSRQKIMKKKSCPRKPPKEGLPNFHPVNRGLGVQVFLPLAIPRGSAWLFFLPPANQQGCKGGPSFCHFCQPKCIGGFYQGVPTLMW